MPNDMENFISILHDRIMLSVKATVRQELLVAQAEIATLRSLLRDEKERARKLEEKLKQQAIEG